MKKLVTEQDIVANANRDLERIQTLKMSIDTDDPIPIKLKPYWTPIHKWRLVEEAVGDMLESWIIERSTSP